VDHLVARRWLSSTHLPRTARGTDDKHVTSVNGREADLAHSHATTALSRALGSRAKHHQRLSDRDEGPKRQPCFPPVER